MAFSNNQTRVAYNIDGKDVKDINKVFKHMYDNNLTSVDTLNLTDQTVDAAIYEVPDDNEFIGISSFSVYLADPTETDSSELDNLDSSSGVTGGITIGPTGPTSVNSI